MKHYTTPFVSIVGPASATIQGPPVDSGDGMGNALSVLPSNLEEQ